MGGFRKNGRFHTRKVARSWSGVADPLDSLPWSAEAPIKPVLSIEIQGPAVKVSWQGEPEHIYQIERCAELSHEHQAWISVGMPMWGAGIEMSLTYLLQPGETRMFFRAKVWRFDVEPESVDFDLVATSLSPTLLEAASVISENVHDGVRTTTKSDKLAVNFQLSIANAVGDPGAATFSIARGEDKATVDPVTGHTTYQADGSFVAQADAGGVTRQVSLTSQSSQTSWERWAPREDLGAGQVLVIYNTAFAESVQAKDYYLANRPAATGFEVLGVSCLPHERIAYADYLAQIQEPVDAWLAAHPGHTVRYIVMMHGLPTRLVVDEPNAPYWSHTLVSVPWALSGAYDPDFPGSEDWGGSANEVFIRAKRPHWRGLVTFLGMGSLANTLAYIDRLSNAPAQSADGLKLAGSGADHFLFDDFDSMQGGIGNTGAHYTTAYRLMFEAFKIDDDPALLGVNWVLDPALRHTYRSPEDVSGPILSAADVASYINWGLYAAYNGEHFGDAAALDGRRIWTGNSWYAMTSIESFNGQRNTPFPFLGLQSSGSIMVHAEDKDPDTAGTQYDIWVNRLTGTTWEHDGSDWVSTYNERIHNCLYPRMQYHKELTGLRGFAIHYSDTEPTRLNASSRDWWILTTDKKTKMWNPGLTRWEAPMSTWESWFAPGAFNTDPLSTAQCPIVATAHTEEPFLWRGSSAVFFKAWRQGWPFAECAWAGRQGASSVIYIGDPLVCLHL